MWGLKLPSDTPIVLAVFGIQALPSNNAGTLIEAFDTLISPHAPSIENLEQNDPVATRLWLSYWPSRASFDEWWSSPPVASFWSSLPDDAGVYREIMTVPPGRTQHGTNVLKQHNGMAKLGVFEDIGDKSGYWGCYYDRMADVTRERRNEFRSSTETRPARVSALAGTPANLHRGRVTINDLPENIAFVVEGQDHSLIQSKEKEYWMEHFDQPVTNWIRDLVDAGPQAGILETRLCYDPSKGLYRSPKAQPPALNYNRKVQLFYFQDFEAMEKIGRENKGHIKLRREFLQSYGPGGAMGELPGKLCLWVEASLLKASEIEAEYVGCVEGTGFMGLSWE
ncbi:phenylacetaldoxime dehydratase family protein [Aspergillus mulundensis]|uniref:Phenylacetaldoxime dehydratase n=1 Tax=Aspergillus mulundensis TaxID=1810919 RepID=A0A3D8SL59_9EURO|nr:hypothetical protein DSM5745_03658 [Aspergillus mulundensis]RDW87016.1 hypothetical protein DSM5745_03658 [Aspergillus mulundensis]